MKKFIAALAAVAMLATPSVSDAAFKVRVDAGDDGVFEATITDGGAGDASAIAGAIVHTAAYGAFLITVSTAFSKPIVGSAHVATMTLDVSVTSLPGVGGVGTIRVLATDTDFAITGAPGFGVFTAASTANPNGGTVSFTNSVGPGNVEFGAGPPTIAQGPFGGAVTAVADSTVIAAANPFSITQSVKLTSTGGMQTINGDTRADVVVVPEPATLALWGGFGAAGMVWRRRRKQKKLAETQS